MQEPGTHWSSTGSTEIVWHIDNGGSPALWGKKHCVLELMVPRSTMSSVSPPSSCFCRNFSAVAAQTVLLRNHWLQIVLLGRAWFVSVWADSLSLLAIHGKGRIQHLPLQHCNSAGRLMVGCNKTKSTDTEKQCFAATARLWGGHLINMAAPVAWRQVV